MQNELKTLRINAENYSQLNKLNTKLKRPKKQVVEELINYAVRLDIDPQLVKVGNPAAATDKLRKDIIAFIKTQEKVMLKPMIESISLVSKKVNAAVDEIPSKAEVSSSFDKAYKNHRILDQKLKSLSAKIESQTELHFEKKKYKEAIIKAVQLYVEEREKLSSPLQKKKINEIQNNLILKINAI